MRDSHDNQPTNSHDRRGRRPARPTGAMDPAARKREQRARQITNINERDSHDWTESECMMVLSGPKWRDTVLALAAWRQLGKLRGFS